MDLKALRQRDTELRVELADVTEQRADIGNAALKEKRAMSDDERKQFTEVLPAHIKTIKAQVEDNSAMILAAEEAEVARENVTVPTPTPDEVVSAKAAAHVIPQQDRVARVEVEDETQKPGYFGRQLQAVAEFAANGRTMSNIPESHRALLRPMMATSPTGANSDVGSEGGFLVDKQRSSSVMERSYSQGQVLSRVNRIPIGAGFDGIKLPAVNETSRANGSRFGGIASGWLGQGGTLTAGQPEFRIAELELRKIGALVYATDELLKDAVAFESWVNTHLPQELTFRAEDAVFNGTGAAQPQGLLNSGAAITITRGTASRVIYDDVRAMWARLYAPSRMNAAWFVDQEVEAELEQMSITIGTGGQLVNVYRPAGERSGQDTPTLYGRPVIVTEYGASLGTVGDIILTDLSQYWMIDKGSVEQAVSIHVQFLTDQSVFRFIYRVDGQLSWNSALTPKSGGATQSVVITLT